MIRGNLSTRPFYNERAVQLWLLLLAAIVGVATVFNIARVVRYSQTDTELASQASRDEASAAEMRTEASRLRAGVDMQQIELASAEARQANELIDRRTFSWTDLFNQFEATFPDEVRIAAVRPNIDEKGALVLTIDVVARSVDVVDELIRNLEGTGSFNDLLSVEEHFNSDGMLEASLEGHYVSRRATPEARPASTTPGAAAAPKTSADQQTPSPESKTP
jgi:Tfp pilus assembly protein PilN